MKMKMMKFWMSLKKWLNPRKNKFLMMKKMINIKYKRRFFKLIGLALMIIKHTWTKIKNNKIMNKTSSNPTIQQKVNGLLMKNHNFLCLKTKSLHILKKPTHILSLNKNKKRFNRKKSIFRFVSHKIWNVKMKSTN